jgi:hypothetical protein
VWLSDVLDNNTNTAFTTEGTPMGVSWPAPWAGAWPGDMAYDAGRDLMCQVNVGGDNGIYCWDPTDGSVVASITGPFPWTGISQRGLAYRPDDDSFYIGGWNEGILYHVKGLSWDVPGEVIGQCSPPDGDISGLAWNPAYGIIWEATNSPTDTIYQLDPEGCDVLDTLAHPDPGFGGAGLSMDELGNLWMIDQEPNTVYLIDSGVPSFIDVPWLSADPASGSVPVGGEQPIQVTVDTTDLETGVYHATLFLVTNSGRQPVLTIPVEVIVPAYAMAVNAGGDDYTDLAGDLWYADQPYTEGDWGYLGRRARPHHSRFEIGGTEDDPLYQYLRQEPAELDYLFDGLAEGLSSSEGRARPGGSTSSWRAAWSCPPTTSQAESARSLQTTTRSSCRWWTASWRFGSSVRGASPRPPSTRSA